MLGISDGGTPYQTFMMLDFSGEYVGNNGMKIQDR
jgi:hypothetical protein